MPYLSRRAVIGTALAASAAIGVPTALLASATSPQDNYPADKMSVSGSSFDVMGPDNNGTSSVVLLESHLRTSTTEDLILNASAECDILTQIRNGAPNGANPDAEHAFAQVKLWVTIDGAVVPVAADDTGDDAGKVVFCNRTHDATSSFNDSSEFYQSYLETRSANAFQWVALNVGNGVKDVQLHAEFVAQTMGANMPSNLAKAAVGKRTLVIEPTKAAHNEANDSGLPQ
jgi:hypothetical protein